MSDGADSVPGPRPSRPVTAPALPHTWRPFGARMAGGLLGALLVAVIVVVWLAFSPEDRARFSGLERATLIFLGVLAFACWYALMRNRVTATDKGLTVVNGYRRRDYEWAQVLGISLRRGAPWAGIDLSDGTTISAVGIQGSDGPRAVTAVREIRALISERSRAPGRND